MTDEESKVLGRILMQGLMADVGPELSADDRELIRAGLIGQRNYLCGIDNSRSIRCDELIDHFSD